MDELIALFVLIGILKAISKGARKRKQKAAPPQTGDSHVQKRTEPEAPAPPVQAAGEGQSVYAPPPEYAGSMYMDSTEGEDLCDPALEHDRPERTDPHSVYANEIGVQHRLDFSPEGLWQGVVMSEILTRPADRQRRKGASWKN